MGKNLKGSTLETQVKNSIIRRLNLGVKKGDLSTGFIHSCARIDSNNNTLFQLANFLEKNGFDKKFNLVTASWISEFLESKVEDGNSDHTIMNHLSVISSTFTALDTMGYSIKISSEDFNDLRKEFKGAGYKNVHQNRAFKNPEEVIEKLYEMRLSSGLLAELQLTCGYRIHEALQVCPEIIEFKDNELYVIEGAIRGKGGFPLQRKKISSEMSKKIGMQFMVLEGWEITADTYNNDIKYVSDSSYSSHSFRYNFAQDEYQKNVDKDLDVKEAKRQVSESMGHHRPHITDHYLD